MLGASSGVELELGDHRTELKLDGGQIEAKDLSWELMERPGDLSF